METIQIQDYVLNIENICWVRTYHRDRSEIMLPDRYGHEDGPFDIEEQNLLYIGMKGAREICIDIDNQAETQSAADRIQRSMGAHSVDEVK